MQISQMKQKYVGSSNENLVQALGVIRALSQGRALFIATMNGMVSISGPLKRRFNFGTYMFDLPTPELRARAHEKIIDNGLLLHDRQEHFSG